MVSFQNTCFKHPKLRTVTQTLLIKKTSTKHSFLFGVHSYQCLNIEKCCLSLHKKHTFNSHPMSAMEVYEFYQTTVNSIAHTLARHVKFVTN